MQRISFTVTQQFSVGTADRHIIADMINAHAFSGGKALDAVGFAGFFSRKKSIRGFRIPFFKNMPERNNYAALKKDREFFLE